MFSRNRPTHTLSNLILNGEPLWLSGKVVKNEKINEIERTRVRSPPRDTSLKKLMLNCFYLKTWPIVLPTYVYNLKKCSMMKSRPNGENSSQSGHPALSAENFGEFILEKMLPWKRVGVFHSDIHRKNFAIITFF
jgi:hypothetical protein